MLDFTQINSAFAELVGYNEENEITLDASLKNSDSGLKVNSLPGVDLISIQKSLFLKSDLTREKTVSEYLTGIYNPTIQSMLMQFIAKTQTYLMESAVKYQSYIESFSRAYDLAENSGYFVGYILNLRNGFNLFAQIEAISLKLKEAQNITVYLFDTAKKTAISSFELNYTDAESVQSFDLTDWILQFKDDLNQDKLYMIGFFESDLTATNKFYIQYSDNLTVNELNYVPIGIKSDYLDSYNLPAYEYAEINAYSYFTVKVKIECDYTELLVNNKLKFAELLQISLAKQIISDCLSSKEFNDITESNNKNWQNMLLHFNNLINGYAFTDSYGNSGRKAGLNEEIIQQFEGIDKNCFPKRRIFVL